MAPKRVAFAVSETQAADVKRRASDAGCSVSEFVRNLVFPPPPPTAYQLFHLLNPNAETNAVMQEVMNRYRAKKGLDSIPSKTPDLDAHYRKLFPEKFEEFARKVERTPMTLKLTEREAAAQ